MKKIILVAMLALNGLGFLSPLEIAAQETGVGIEKKEDLHHLTKKVTADDVELTDIEWTFSDALSDEEVKTIKENIKTQGLNGLAFLANLNNGLLEDEDFVFHPVVEESLDMTKEEVNDMFTDLALELQNDGYEPNYDEIGLEIREDPEVGEMVACIIPWYHPDEEGRYIQTLNLSYEGEIIGLFLEPEAEN